MIKNKFLLRKGLFALLLSCSTMVSATAEERGALFVNLKDGSKVQFVLPTQIPNVNFSNSIIPSTEVTTVQYDDFKAPVMGLSLLYETRASNRQVRSEEYNRIMRIAEIRLIPITE